MVLHARACRPGFNFVNNSIQSRRFGVLCMGRDGVIKDNTFTDNPGPSVLLINDDDYDDVSLAVPSTHSCTHSKHDRRSCLPTRLVNQPRRQKASSDVGGR